MIFIDFVQPNNDPLHLKSVTRTAMNKKKKLQMNKYAMKKYPHILTYRRSLSKTMILDICILSILKNINFSNQQ